MFSSQQVPAVGVSIGVERVFAIMEAQMRDAAAAAGGVIRETETEVLVASIGGGMQPTRMRLAAALWAGGVKAEFGYKAAPKMADQLGYALKAGIPFMVLFGDSELAAGVVKIKDLDANAEETVPEVRRRWWRPVGWGVQCVCEWMGWGCERGAQASPCPPAAESTWLPALLVCRARWWRGCRRWWPPRPTGASSTSHSRSSSSSRGRRRDTVVAALPAAGAGQ